MTKNHTNNLEMTGIFLFVRVRSLFFVLTMGILSKAAQTRQGKVKKFLRLKY